MRYTSMRSTSLCSRATPRSRCREAMRRPPTPTRRSRGTPSASSRPAPPCRWGSARSPTRSRQSARRGGRRADYGLHSEMFTDGCMKLHRAEQDQQRAQGAVRRGKRHDVRVRLAGAVRVAGRQRGTRPAVGIVPWFGADAVITIAAHQVDVIVTEYGAADRRARPSGSAAEALAAIATPAVP